MEKAGYRTLKLASKFPYPFFSRGFSLGVVCALLWGALLSACASPQADRDSGPSGLYGVRTVSFDKNGGDTEAEPSRMTLLSSADTLAYLPEEPTRRGFRFVGWNTERDGSGERFTENTRIDVDIILIVYAQWKPVLNFEVSYSGTLLTPLPEERFSTVGVVVSGFQNEADVRSVALAINPPEGLKLKEVRNLESARNTRSFAVTLEYNGVTAFPGGTASIRLNLVPEDYPHEEAYIHLRVVDGQEATRPIVLHEGNIKNFNHFANTKGGLKLHYRLTEDIRLEAPVAPATSNWTPIGKYVNNFNDDAFAGGFDGGGFKIAGLTLRSPDSDYLGFFGIAVTGAEIKNLGLEEVHISGRDDVGSLVGRSNGGTVQNSYAVGSVEGHNIVGGLVGYNDGGTVQNSYAIGSVSGAWSVGGLVGNSNGTVQNSYATGSVSGTDRVIGGLVGMNNSGTVQNSYATGSVSSTNKIVGGLIGSNSGTVRNSVALNSSVTQTADTTDLGRVAGGTGGSWATSTEQNNYARAMMMRNNNGATYEPSVIGANSKDGTTVSPGTGTGQYNNIAFWRGVFQNFDNHWQWNVTSRLPVLRNVGGAQNHTAP